MASSKIDELLNDVRARGGIHSVQMKELRDAFEYKKTGSNVIQVIHDELLKRGFGHVPAELPLFQGEWVRIYEFGTKYGKLVNAAINPDPSFEDLIRSAIEATTEGVVRSQLEEILSKLGELERQLNAKVLA